jgi:hypothetical protein
VYDAVLVDVPEDIESLERPRPICSLVRLCLIEHRASIVCDPTTEAVILELCRIIDERPGDDLATFDFHSSAGGVERQASCQAAWSRAERRSWRKSPTMTLSAMGTGSRTRSTIAWRSASGSNSAAMYSQARADAGEARSRG